MLSSILRSSGGRTLIDLARRISGSATLVQLRDKHGSTRAMVEEARALRAVLEPNNIPLLINDRVDVALAAEADGVHIGQDDIAPDDARLLLGRSAIIGLSIKTVEQAKVAPLDLLDYVAIGGVYGTTSKDNTAAPIGIDGLRTIVQVIRARDPHYPICAIAGITAGNAADVIAAGADGVAVISALSLASDPAAAARDLRTVGRQRSRAAWAVMTAIALTIAGSDSSGGAGIQADLKTFAALGVYGASVITALTAQNTQGVRGIHDVPASFIRAQTDAVFSDLDVAAVKIGMLSQVATIEAVEQGLVAHSAKNIVLDPVMVATSGDRLLAPEAVEALRRKLVPRALVVTPNLPEAAVLVGASVARNEREMEVQAREILALGPRNVLIKGGHGVGDESVDLLIGEGDVVRLSAKRIVTTSLHGTGCTLSSAIAAGLARGLDLKRAAQEAKTYVTAAIAAARDLNIGHGHGPLHHFHATWSES